MHDIVIRNGTLVTASDRMVADLAIRNGRIFAIGADLGPAAREIDATGLLVMPGGVDSHVHCEQRGNAWGPHLESFATATRSAAFGGTTSFISFARQVKGETVETSVAEYRERAAAATIDYSFHLTITDATDAVLEQELPRLAEQGLRSIKIFMTTHRSRVEDDAIIRILRFARAHGVLVVVHAENYAASNALSEAAEALDLPPALRACEGKPPIVEREAVHRIISLAELFDTPVQIFHVTCREALKEIERAQRRGVRIFAETCPQYLTLARTDIEAEGVDDLRFIFGPPPRNVADQDALWSAIRRGTIGVVSSDHAPHNLDGPDGKRGKADGPAEAIPHGIPGIETRLPLLFHHGVTEGRIEAERFVAVSSTNPAKLFGLWPQKGSLAIGADADIALWDPSLTREIRNAGLHHAVDYTPYEGRVTTGWPVITLSRGQVIVDRDAWLAEPARGRFLSRAAYPLPLSPVH